MKFFTGSVLAFGLLSNSVFADVTISVDASANTTKISPYIYGRNIDKISDGTEDIDSDEQSAIGVMNEAGIRFLRANNGNNATRYNWRKKMTVHPDWYNNVYSHSWDITAKKVLDEMPGIDAMYAFQLTGYAASSTEHNFSDWDFYQENGAWATGTLDLAGGGEVASDGKTLVEAGDYKLYNEEWPADSTVGIIGHWQNELEYDMSRFQYWSMDNEMDIWMGTHGDLPLDVDADFLVARYVDVAKKARAAWKDIKLTGPVVANEWQWCSVGVAEGKSGLGKGEDRDYCWIEYFIKRVAEEQKKSGVRLLDVFDMHWYPTEKTYAERMNWHRVFFDTTYNYSGTNGMKLVTGKWDNNQKKEYVFKRVNEWLDKYFGENHGITLGLTETDFIADDAMTTALTYASFLGTFMDNGVELFTPWSWGDGMYEVVHLFSRYGREYRIPSVSSNDSLVSAYTSVNDAKDGMTVIIVNRDETGSQNVSLSIAGLKNSENSATTLTLAELSGETFVSHSSNALKSGTAAVADGKVSLSVPAKSITAVVVGSESVAIPRVAMNSVKLFARDGAWYLDNAAGNVNALQVFDARGTLVSSLNQVARGNAKITSDSMKPGIYLVRMNTTHGAIYQRIAVK